MSFIPSLQTFRAIIYIQLHCTDIYNNLLLIVADLSGYILNQRKWIFVYSNKKQFPMKLIYLEWLVIISFSFLPFSFNNNTLTFLLKLLIAHNIISIFVRGMFSFFVRKKQYDGLWSSLFSTEYIFSVTKPCYFRFVVICCL